MNELIVTNENDFAVMQKQASVMLKSGFLPSSIKTPEQALTIMLKGRELRIPYMEALSSINVIQGKPTIAPQLMLALARRTGELEDLRIEEDEEGCEVTVKRKGQSPYSCFFGEEEANHMGLIGKDNYKKQAKTMYKWRALSANLRVTFGDAICGLYLHEEINPDLPVDAEGKIEEPKNITPPKEEPKAPEKLPEPPKAEKKPENFLKPEPDRIEDVVHVHLFTMTEKTSDSGTKFYILESDGKKYRTFSKTAFEELKIASDSGYGADLQVENNKYGYSIVSYEIVMEEAVPA